MQFSRAHHISESVEHNPDNAGYGSKRLRLAPRRFVHAICEPLVTGHVIIGTFLMGLRECHACKGQASEGFVIQFSRDPNYRDLTKEEREQRK